MTKREDITDEELVAQARKNQAAFAEIVQRYEEKLSRYIRRLGASQQQDTEDVLQNVFIKVYKNLNGFDQSLSFSSWIYRITHNEVVSFFRKKSVRPQGHYTSDAEEALQRIKSDNDTSLLAEQELHADQLKAGLTKLDQKYKDILILRYFEEREYKEISDILQIPTNSVGTLIHRAKKALAKHMKHLQ